VKPSISLVLSCSLIALVACNSSDSKDTNDTGTTTVDTGTTTATTTDTATATTTDTATTTTTDTATTDTGGEADPTYDAGISIQDNLDKGVSVLSILDHHEVSELYGLSHAGGYIFHIDENTGSGMVSHSITDSGPTHWNDFSNPAPDLGLGSEIGYGEPNTNAIVGALGTDVYAARYAYDAETNDFTDWFLPSIDELTAVYENLHLAGLGGAASGYSYWSSTDEATGAWVIYFANGNTYTPNKTHDHHHALPVRNF
jgi:hypothetical protein